MTYVGKSSPHEGDYMTSRVGGVHKQDDTDLQQAGGSRETQRERLAADVERLGVGLLRAHRKRVHSSSGKTATGQSEQGVRTKRQRRVRGVVQVEHCQTQGGQTKHECCLDGSTKSSWINYSIHTHKCVNKHKKLSTQLYLYCLCLSEQRVLTIRHLTIGM